MRAKWSVGVGLAAFLFAPAAMAGEEDPAPKGTQTQKQTNEGTQTKAQKKSQSKKQAKRGTQTQKQAKKGTQTQKQAKRGTQTQKQTKKGTQTKTAQAGPANKQPRSRGTAGQGQRLQSRQRARFVDRDGDGIMDGQERRFRRSRVRGSKRGSANHERRRVRQGRGSPNGQGQGGGQPKGGR